MTADDKRTPMKRAENTVGTRYTLVRNDTKNTHEVWIRRGNYNGQVRGGIEYTWRVVQMDMNLPAAEALYAKKLKGESEMKTMREMINLIEGATNRGPKGRLPADQQAALDDYKMQEALKRINRYFFAHQANWQQDEEGNTFVDIESSRDTNKALKLLAQNTPSMKVERYSTSYWGERGKGPRNKGAHPPGKDYTNRVYFDPNNPPQFPESN